jgi:predicted GTPase
LIWRRRTDDIIILVMGITGSGKSTFIGCYTGDVSGIGHSLESRKYELCVVSSEQLADEWCIETKDVSWGTLRYEGHTIRLIDTPGFDDSRNELDDTHILKEIASWLVIAYSAKPPLLLSGIIYLHPINEAGGRMRGSAKNNLKMFQAMCGSEPLSSVVLATTMWKYVDEQRGEKIQRQLSQQYWSSMIDAGSQVIRHDDTKDSALRIIDTIMSREAQVSLKIQRELVDKDQSVENTDAGRELKHKVNNERDKTEEKL